MVVESRMDHLEVRRNDRKVREERSPFFSFTSDRRDPVFCPKPRRISQLSGAEPIRPMRRLLGPQMEPYDPRPEAEVLDIILAKGGAQGCGQVASSPPYICGSPPIRAANPLVLDARFGEEDVVPSVPLPMPTVSEAPSSSAVGHRSCVRIKLGANPATVRIEGFDCLDRGGRRSGITSVA